MKGKIREGHFGSWANFIPDDEQLTRNSACRHEEPRGSFLCSSVIPRNGELRKLGHPGGDGREDPFTFPRDASDKSPAAGRGIAQPGHVQSRETGRVSRYLPLALAGTDSRPGTSFLVAGHVDAS